jgi:hypothetical protein
MSIALDTTGDNLQNMIIGESMTFARVATNPFHVLTPLSGPFFAQTMYIRFTPTSGTPRTLIENVDYKLGYIYKAATDACNRMICGGVYFLDLSLAGTITYTCQVLGGSYAIPLATANIVHALEMRDPEVTTWEQVCTARAMALAAFPVVTHQFLRDANVDYDALVRSLEQAGLTVHLRPSFLPTPDQIAFIPSKAEVGLGNVQNYPMATQAQAAAGVLDNVYLTPKGAALTAQAVVLQQMAQQGYKVAVPYAALLTVSDPLQQYSYLGDVYTPKASMVPFTTSGTFESTKFQLVSSITRDAWTETSISIVGTETLDASGNRVLTTGLNLLCATDSRAVLNDLLELVPGLDYYLTPTKLVVCRPTGPNDVIILHTRAMKSRVADPVPYYKSFSVTNAQVLDYALDPLDNIDWKDLQFRLNDMIVMSWIKGDYTVTGNSVHIAYPLALGDVVEVLSRDCATDIGRMELRNLLTQ